MEGDKNEYVGREHTGKCIISKERGADLYSVRNGEPLKGVQLVKRLARSHTPHDQ